MRAPCAPYISLGCCVPRSLGVYKTSPGQVARTAQGTNNAIYLTLVDGRTRSQGKSSLVAELLYKTEAYKNNINIERIGNEKGATR